MFKILSKESNIFSIPIYLGVLLLVLTVLNPFEINTINIISSIIAFSGLSLGYFIINEVKTELVPKTHLTLLLLTCFNICLYPNVLDIGISWTILSNMICIWILTSNNKKGNNHYVLIGSLFALNFILLPTIWPVFVFYILHIFVTTRKTILNLFRFLFGIFIMAISYFSIAYFLNFNSWNSDYLPLIHLAYSGVGIQLLYLIPVVLLVIYGVFDYFSKQEKIGVEIRFKYIFLLLYFLTLLIVTILYMGLSTEYLLLTTLPVSIIICRALHYTDHKKIQEIGIWLVIISLMAFRFSQ